MPKWVSSSSSVGNPRTRLSTCEDAPRAKVGGIINIAVERVRKRTIGFATVCIFGSSPEKNVELQQL
jgi:hypothetical protein